MRINGTEVATSTKAASFGNTLTMKLYDAQSSSGGTVRNTTGDFLDHGMFAAKLSLAEAQLLEGYLAHRLNLTGLLPSNHPYKTVAPV